MTENTLEKIQNDSVVQMAYTLFVDDKELESNVMEYLHGHSNIISGLEAELTDLKVGDNKDVLVEAANAYGAYDPDMVMMVSRESFPPNFEIHLGEAMRLRDASGHVFSGVATALTDNSVELDLNHPMAGKDLQFNVTVLSIRPASEAELAAGSLHQHDCEGCGSGGCSDGSCSDDCCA